jgi:AAA domain/UvrD-like helicase C-terminal domain
MSTALDKLRAAHALNQARKAEQQAPITVKTLSATEKLKALVEKNRATTNLDLARSSLTNITANAIQAPKQQVPVESTEPVAEVTVWNVEQQAAIDLAAQGSSFCLIGSAGTGKTTTEREIVLQAVNKMALDLGIHKDKIEPSKYVLVTAFTRRAVRNTFKALRKLGDKYTACCATAHKALKYEPVWYELEDEDGVPYKTMRFEPQVTAEAPNTDVLLIIVDEASMLGYQSLYRQLVEGFPNAKFIFIGDLNQLKPVMDDPTLAYKLNDLPVVELTHVYRQALTSPIVSFQYDYTLKGKVPTLAAIAEYNKAKEGLSFFQIPWKFQDTESYARVMVDKYFKPAYEKGLYNPDDAMILIPYNKRFGSILINQGIAQFLGQERHATVHEVIAGGRRKYFAIGDYVLHDKRECTITGIDHNARYSGLAPKDPSPHLLRTGHYDNGDPASAIDIMGAQDFVFSSDGTGMADSNAEEQEQKLKAASHIITLLDRETGVSESISTIGEINAMDWSYCMTIHKSQGSEWRKVYLILHQAHATGLSRELLYTGMTRAAEELVVCWGADYRGVMGNSALGKAILRQDIKGATWKEKAAAFGIKGEGLAWRG